MSSSIEVPLILIIIIVGVSKTENAIPLGARPTFPTFPQVVWLEESLVLKKAVSKSLFSPKSGLHPTSDRYSHV